MKYVTGDKKLDRRLNAVKGPIARRVMVQGIRAGMAEVREAIRSEVPYPSVRRAIGSRFKKRKGSNNYRAIVGGGVGKRNKRRPSRKGGVGIAKENVHWYLMGTSGRHNGIRYLGAMPEHPAVQKGFNKSAPAAMAAVREKIAQELNKTLKKLR